jgi:signal transduction histidine kinase
MSDPGKTQKLLNQLSDWLGRATQEGRTALESLHATEAGDLAAALRTIIEGFRANCDIELSLSVSGSSRDTTGPVRDEVYWIAYEAIRNACKHSGAHHISVNLIYNKGLELRICDDGRGIPEDISREGRIGHFGLRGMRERASQIGAALTISSSAQNGTEVRLVVPGGKIFVSKRSGPPFSLR